MDPSNWIPSPSDIVMMQQTCWLDEPERALPLMAPDVVSTMNVDGAAVPMGGDIVGRAEVLAKLSKFRQVFEIVDYRPRIYAAEGDTVRSRVNLLLRHRLSGETLICKKRTVYTIRDGLIIRVDEYVDQAMMETFMRMVSMLGAEA